MEKHPHSFFETKDKIQIEWVLWFISLSVARKSKIKIRFYSMWQRPFLSVVIHFVTELDPETNENKTNKNYFQSDSQWFDFRETI